MASYTKLAKNNWQVVISLGYDANGKKKRIKKQGFKLKSDAEKFVTETLQKRNDGYLVKDDNKLTFKDTFLEWYEHCKKPTLSIHTQDYYTRSMKNHLFPYFGSFRLKEIDNLIVQKFYNNLINEKKLCPSSAKKVINVLIVFFKYAKKQKMIFEMPTDIVEVKYVNTKINCWNKEEVDFFLDKIKDSNIFKPVFIDLFTGLRIAELCGLRWCDLNIDKSLLTINNQAVYSTQNKKLQLAPTLKTSSSHRTIVIPEVLANYLRKIKEEKNPLPEDFIVTNMDGLMENPHCLSMRFKRAVKKFKKSLEDKKKEDPTIDEQNYMQLNQITFHGLRHTHATLLLAYGENVKVVSERLGHKNISMTLNTYTHVLNKMRTNSAKILDDIFDN